MKDVLEEKWYEECKICGEKMVMYWGFELFGEMNNFLIIIVSFIIGVSFYWWAGVGSAIGFIFLEVIVYKIWPRKKYFN